MKKEKQIQVQVNQTNQIKLRNVFHGCQGNGDHLSTLPLSTLLAEDKVCQCKHASEDAVTTSSLIESV